MGDNRTIRWRRGIAITFCVNVQVKAEEVFVIDCLACRMVMAKIAGEVSKNSTKVRGARQYSTRTFI